MGPKLSARIAGTGSYTPPRKLTNADFEKLLDTSDEWIVTRTGIRERRIGGPEIATSDMASAACQRALDMAGTAPEEIDLLILATVTPDYPVPSCACVVQDRLGLKNAAAFDVVAACSGFINALSIGQTYISSGQYRKVLVAGAEKLSAIANYNDRSTCVLFGDAAGAVLLEPTTDGSGVLSTFMKSDGSMLDWLWIKQGGTRHPIEQGYAFDGSDKLQMSGSDVFKVAVREMERASRCALERAGVSAHELKLVVPHQANLRIIEGVAKRLGVCMDQVYLNIDKYGNTSSASIPLALDEANREGRLDPGDYVLMVAFGGGMFWAAAVVKW